MLSKKWILPDYYLKILMIIVLTCAFAIQKPKETHANPLALLLIPGFVNSAYVTGALGILGIGAVGATSSEWYNDKVEELEQTLMTSTGLIATDMKRNLEKSIEDLLLGKEAVFNFTGELLNNILNSLNSNSSTISTELAEQIALITIDEYGIYRLPPNLQVVGTSTTSTTIDTFREGINFNVIDSRGTTHFRFGNLSYASFPTGSIIAQQVETAFYYAIATGNILAVLSFFNSVTSSFNFGIQYIGNDIYYPTNEGSLLLDEVADYLTQQLLNNNNKLGLPLNINDLVNLKSIDGTPLYVDQFGNVVLRDGRPFEGDLTDVIANPRVPSVTDLSGTLTPTLSTDFGMVNIKTGEVIIPNPNPPTPNPPPKVKPDSARPPAGIQKFLPIAVVIVFIIFLKSIVMYAIRLFDYLLSIPFIPAIPINNHAFQWFKTTEFLGIQVYSTVIAFATFCFSFTVYKVIRRIW